MAGEIFYKHVEALMLMPATMTYALENPDDVTAICKVVELNRVNRALFNIAGGQVVLPEFTREKFFLGVQLDTIINEYFFDTKLTSLPEQEINEITFFIANLKNAADLLLRAKGHNKKEVRESFKTLRAIVISNNDLSILRN